MKWVLAAALVASVLFPGCSCNHHHGNGDDVDADTASPCDPTCAAGSACRYLTCVPTPTACGSNADCTADNYCDTSANECIPWGVGPGGSDDTTCTRTPEPGVFFPGVQCEWLGPPPGDAYPDHVNVLGTPMVAPIYHAGEFSTPSIIFVSYNFTDGGAQSCEGTDPRYFGVIRIIDGVTCELQDEIAMPTVLAAPSLAVGDIGGADATPEIVAARTDGGLVAFTLGSNGWETMWQTASTFGDTLCDWAGPSIHDLDDDGVPEIMFYGNVYDAHGNALDESLGASVTTYDNGSIPVVADVDGDGIPELVTGTELYSWDKANHKWAAKQALGGPAGFVAVADFGTFPQATGVDDRAHTDGIAEVAVIDAGVARVYNIFGRLLFTANLQGTGGGAAGFGGPPTIADFDGDGRVELASAGATGYNVLDPDCTGTPDPATCPSMTTNGVLWVQPSQDLTSNVTGSSVFDFDGDGRAEAIYGDECFTRVYDGVTGKVLYSRYRTSCTWLENPVIADVDADFSAEIVSTSNTNCGVTCPAVDPIFDGVQCSDDSDCPGATRCGREQPADTLGRCRCGSDVDCGGDGFVCLDPIAGPSAAGQVCRASHPVGTEATGVRVLGDIVDRWTNTRPIWNQHAYSVTNVTDAGGIPRTSDWLQNWKQPGLNNFRQNSPGTGESANESPDLTVQQAKVTCDASGLTVTASVCDRGTGPVAVGVPVAVYSDGPPKTLACDVKTSDVLLPGGCAIVTCTAPGGMTGTATVVVDDRGDGTGIHRECREDNNALSVPVSCP